MKFGRFRSYRKVSHHWKREQDNKNNNNVFYKANENRGFWELLDYRTVSLQTNPLFIDLVFVYVLRVVSLLYTLPVCMDTLN